MSCQRGIVIILMEINAITYFRVLHTSDLPDVDLFAQVVATRSFKS